MGITMRLVQQFDPAHEREFKELERQFAELAARRSDYPKGRRMQPIAGAEPNNTLIWEREFPDLEAAHRALDFFRGDAEHEALFIQQSPLLRQVRVEFYQNLGMP